MRKAGTLENSLDIYLPWWYWQIEYENAAAGGNMQRYLDNIADGRFCGCCCNTCYDSNWQFHNGDLCPACERNHENGDPLCNYKQHYNNALAKRYEELEESRGLRIQLLSTAQLEEENIYVPPS